MLTNQTHSKRLSQPLFKKIKAYHISSQESEELEAEHQVEIERMKNIMAARCIAVMEVIVAIFMLLGLCVKYWQIGYIPEQLFQFTSFAATMMIVHAILLWRIGREHPLQLDKK